MINLMQDQLLVGCCMGANIIIIMQDQDDETENSYFKLGLPYHEEFSFAISHNQTLFKRKQEAWNTVSFNDECKYTYVIT